MRQGYGPGGPRGGGPGYGGSGYGGGGYGPGPGSGSGPGRGRSGGSRSAARRRAVFATKIIAGVLSAAVLLASGWLWLLVRQFNANVNRVNAITNSGRDVDGRDQNILLVGNDNRGGLTDAQLKEIG